MTPAHITGFVAGISLMLAVLVAAWIAQRIAADRAEQHRRERDARIMPVRYVLPKGVASYTSTTKREIRAGNLHGTR